MRLKKKKRRGASNVARKTKKSKFCQFEGGYYGKTSLINWAIHIPDWKKLMGKLSKYTRKL